MFNLQLLVFPTAPHSSSGRNGDSCCVFSNSCLNCAMVLFPIERPELISVWMQSQFGLGPAKHKVLWTGNILIGLAPRAFEICYWVCVRWFFSSQPIAHDQRTTEFSVLLFWNYCANLPISSSLKFQWICFCFRFTAASRNCVVLWLGMEKLTVRRFLLARGFYLLFDMKKVVAG